MKKKRIVIGMVAHVDAGKTTLSEAILYCSGIIRQLGRVDYRDSFFDTNSIERQRGITVFSKQAEFELNNTEVTLLDTPGHVDFVCETERTLSVLDYAVLVISAAAMIQPHTETLWKMLKKYSIPTFIFISKMDCAVAARNDIILELSKHLSDRCLDFSDDNRDLAEQIALCNEKALTEFLENGMVEDCTVTELIQRRLLFPCYFGSGLKVTGVEDFLCGIDRYTAMREYGDSFSAIVYKIARDQRDTRLTFLKVTGGSISAKNAVSYKDGRETEYTEKIDELRIYSGDRYEKVNCVSAGQICAVSGLSASWCGLALGEGSNLSIPVSEPVMNFTAVFPDGESAIQVYAKLKQLAEEDPQLHIDLNRRGNIEFQFMGRVQTEVLCSLIKSRFNINIVFEPGHILYRETISKKTEGVGHYEPLRHYAEVHLLLEPLPPGSGIVVDSICSEDELDRNWQRLILTHVQEKNHLGVLTGSPITDIKITLAAGKAHIKHTEGGDFRQATYRAIRQGLMKTESVLLEPWLSFVIEMPSEQIGRVISDIKAMHGEFSGPEGSGEVMRIVGSAPAALIGGYQEELISFSHGKGKIFLSPGDYRPCRNSKNIIEEIGYDPLSDIENTPDSVFCSHGSGTVIPWNEVEKYMHINSVLSEPKADRNPAIQEREISVDDKELETIMLREFGPIRRKEYGEKKINSANPTMMTSGTRISELWIIDGYNLIFSWLDLKKMALENFDLARTKLNDILVNYSGYSGCESVVVYDAFRTPGNTGSKTEEGNLKIVYTQEGETADKYIEGLSNEIGKNYAVKVVSNDNMIRLTALRSGVLRVSSEEFRQEVELKLRDMRDRLSKDKNTDSTKIKDCMIATNERNV